MQNMIFIGDNGRCTCWNHSGMSIRATGRDISGQEALSLTKDEAAELSVKCETCKAEASA